MCRCTRARSSTTRNRDCSEMNAADHRPAPRPEDSELDLEVDAAGAKQAEEQAEELLREHDTASRYRTDLGLWAWVVGGLSVALTIFHLYTGIFGSRTSLIQGAIHLGGATSVIYLLYPAGKRLSRTKGVPWYDAILAVLGQIGRASCRERGWSAES